MEDKNELNDIILNKSSTASSNKKILLAVATLGIILVVVVMLMNSLSSNGTENLPQAALPPKQDIQSIPKVDEEPLFEDVQIIEEQTNSDDDSLDKIAKKLKAESIAEEAVVITPKVKKVSTKKQLTSQKKQQIVKKKTAPNTILSGKYYIQVGSFSKYAPNKKFLKSITNLNFKYRYYKVKNLNKVLIGPFKTRKDAKDARRIIRAKIEPGAFLVTL